MSHELHKVKVRHELAPRREPYWGAPIGDGLSVGFRKIDAARGSWIARKRNDEPKPRYVYSSLGLLTDSLDYEAARQRALSWSKGRDAGVQTDRWTVGAACREYVADRLREKGKDASRDAEGRFERTVYGRPIEGVEVRRLKTPYLKEWMNSWGLSPAAEERTLTAFKAAMNLSVRNRRVPLEVAQEWAEVQARKGGRRRRELFLDRTQRRKLLNAAEGAAQDLMRGAMLTGARAGELVKAVVSQFEARTRSMTFHWGKGNDGPRSRTVPLSPAAVALFKRLAKGKMPSDPLFTRDDGKPWAHSDWDELVREAGAKAGLPAGVCLYAIRHSFITEAIGGGMSTLEVARLVGTSVMMIEKHYGHLVANAARKRLAAVKML